MSTIRASWYVTADAGTPELTLAASVIADDETTAIRLAVDHWRTVHGDTIATAAERTAKARLERNPLHM